MQRIVFLFISLKKKKTVLHCLCKCELNNYLTLGDDRFSGGQRVSCFMNLKTINKCT